MHNDRNGGKGNRVPKECKGWGIVDLDPSKEINVSEACLVAGVDDEDDECLCAMSYCQSSNFASGELNQVIEQSREGQRIADTPFQADLKSATKAKVIAYASSCMPYSSSSLGKARLPWPPLLLLQNCGWLWPPVSIPALP